jgi:GT2 family glycosyltransferase
VTAELEIISATRLAEPEFWSTSALGKSLKRIGFDRRIGWHIAYSNQRGLPLIYNERIQAPGADALVFMHDDVWLDDYFVGQRVLEGLARFDVIGVAGNRRRVSGQPSWALRDLSLAWDANDNLSGAVAHGQLPFGEITAFNLVLPPAECELMDGVFLAARKSTLNAAGVRFDTRFRFHFYDLDFCRSARQAGLRLGTWPISITHQSGGTASPEWREAFRVYIDKWGG